MSHPSQRLLATMITTTTCGTWLPGDLRGYVDRGVILSHDPTRLAIAKGCMASDQVYLSPAQQIVVFDSLCAA